MVYLDIFLNLSSIFLLFRQNLKMNEKFVKKYDLMVVIFPSVRYYNNLELNLLGWGILITFFWGKFNWKSGKLLKNQMFNIA